MWALKGYAVLQRIFFAPTEASQNTGRGLHPKAGCSARQQHRQRIGERPQLAPNPQVGGDRLLKEWAAHLSAP
jgi:hypothetical protein